MKTKEGGVGATFPQLKCFIKNSNPLIFKRYLLRRDLFKNFIYLFHYELRVQLR